MEILTQNAQETEKLGKELANCLKSGKADWRILALTGELGSGKTVFVQGLARGLGIKKRVLSPTFIMMRQYAIHLKPYTTFYHIDLYRLEKGKDVEGLGLKEILADPQNLVAIEWAEKIREILPKKRIDIYFEYLKNDERRIKINSKL